MKLNVDLFYPIGSIYMSVNSISPDILFGGQWEQIKDRFLLACGDIYENDKTGGEATHKLTINEMPSHNHGLYTDTLPGNTSNSWGVETTLRGSTVYANNQRMTYTGNNQVHNNMPPYLTVYVWKRIA